MVLNLLDELGYYTVEFLLTPRQYGIPNSRLRYYLTARRSSFASDTQANTVWDHIPSTREDDEILSLAPKSISQYLDELVDELTVVPDRVLERWGKLFDIVVPSGDTTCCFTRGKRDLISDSLTLIREAGYTHFVEGTGSVLQTTETLEVKGPLVI
jgi:tRNA (cytosine38-C5)-methyltransferase